MRRATAGLIVVLAVATACTGSSGSDLSTDSPARTLESSATSTPAARSVPVLQVRSVLEVYESSTSAPETTCGGSPTDSCTVSALAQDEVVLRDAGDGAIYRLGPVVVADADVASADAVTHLVNSEPAWMIEIVLTTSGTARFAEATAAMVGKQVAFVVDGVVMSAPTIQEPITSGALVITGDFTEEEADRIASAISP